MRSGGRSVFVTHGGAQIGLGHVKRCLALAKALSEEGDTVSFIVSPDPTTARFIEGAGFSVLQYTWERRPAALLTAVGGTDVDTAIVDSYTARTEHFEALRSVAQQLVAIDDTATRRLPVDVVVNVGAGTESLRDTYDVYEHTRLLLGSRYALLDTAFGEGPVRSHRTKVERVLVTLGASVHAEALRSAVAAVDAALKGVQIGVVTGPFGTPAGMIGAATPGRNNVIDYGGLPELRPVILDADLAVTGAGVTLTEIAATATPAVMIQTEPNQARNVAAFENAGAAISAGPAKAADLHRKVLTAVRRLAEDSELRAHLGAEGRRLIDGQGARRVARELMSLAPARR
jgi:UDP-2,4-diacetamido-2,4,6-trideoxy-beta-L-altropyranose hydrolase